MGDNPASTVGQMSGNMIWSSDYYINKNISDVVMSYIKSTTSSEDKKTIKTIAVGIGILLVADVSKTILLDFMREQKKQVTDEILVGLKYIKIFKRFMERDIDTDILNKIKEYEHSPASIIFRLKNFIKLKSKTDEEIMSSFI